MDRIFDIWHFIRTLDLVINKFLIVLNSSYGDLGCLSLFQVVFFHSLLLSTTPNLFFLQIDEGLLHLLRMWAYLNGVASVCQNLTNYWIFLFRCFEFVDSLVKILFFTDNNIWFNLTLILVRISIVNFFQIFDQSRAMVSHCLAGH